MAQSGMHQRLMLHHNLGFSVRPFMGLRQSVHFTSECAQCEGLVHKLKLPIAVRHNGLCERFYARWSGRDVCRGRVAVSRSQSRAIGTGSTAIAPLSSSTARRAGRDRATLHDWACAARAQSPGSDNGYVSAGCTTRISDPSLA